MNRSHPAAIPLPQHWPDHVKSGVLHAISLAHFAITIVRGWCANSRIARVRLASEVEQLRAELALLREEIRIKDARMAHIPAAQRPHYPPPERLAILQLKAARCWSNGQVARRFLLTPSTIATWLRRLDEEGPDALVQIPVPVNRFPDFVGHVVQTLRSLCPLVGRKRIADVLARAGLHLAPSSVRRFLLAKPRPREPAPREDLPSSSRTVTARHPRHVWNVDLTTIPTAGFWTPWLPRCLQPIWPHCWWILVVVDHFSRRSIGFALFTNQPTSQQVVEAMDRAVARVGKPPRHLISDHGVQFRDDYRDWCARRGIKPRYGALGRYGSIALVERFIRTMKCEGLRRIIIPLSFDAMRAAIASFLRWYDTERPHSALGGATPREIFLRKKPANRRPRLEPRARYPASSPCASPQAPIRGKAGAKVRLVVSHFDGQRHLPVVRLKRAA